MGGTRTPAHDDDGFDLAPLRGAFLDDAGDSLARMESLLLAIGDAAPDDDTLNAIFRFAHSIKGGAATFGFSDVAELTHVVETLLDGLRRRALAVTPATIDTLLESVDMLTRLLARHQSGSSHEIDRSGLLGRLRTLAQRIDPQAALRPDRGPPVERLLDVAIGPLERPCVADDVVALFGEISDVGRCQPADGGVADADGVRRFRVETSVGDGELLDLFSFHVPRDRVRIVPTVTPMPASTALLRSTIRVPVDKIDRLIALAGELLATQASLARAGRGLDPATHGSLAAGLAALERDAMRLQGAVMAVRAVPAAIVFARFPRLLRDLGARLGKPVALRTLGEEVELDTALAERLVDPLTHLVRNAADHGIEPPAERLALGKPEVGMVTLVASRRDGAIVVAVRDDGRGLDRTKLLRMAAERGRVLDDRASDRAVWSLILEPGFTTAAEVTDVSGRGVGMDVVRREVDAMGGVVEIDSCAGGGVCVSMRLPAAPPSRIASVPAPGGAERQEPNIRNSCPSACAMGPSIQPRPTARSSIPTPIVTGKPIENSDS